MRARIVIALSAVLVMLIPVGATPAAALPWHYSPGISGTFVFGPDGALYATDALNALIYRFDSAGHATVIAGIGPPSPDGFPNTTKDHGWTEASGYSGDGGPATDAQLSFPLGLAFDAQGNLYVADHGNDVVRKIDASGIITTVAGVGPSDTWVKGQWVPGLQGKAGDGGPATQAVLESPVGVTFDAHGNLYIVDRDHDAVRKVDRNGIITTVAGTGQRGYSGDGGPATQAKLNRPLNVVFDAAGNMYIADENNARIRKVDSRGVITTIGGTGALGCAGPGSAAVGTPLQNPNDIGFGPDGSLYVVLSQCDVVRRIDSSGTVRAAVGTGAQGCAGLNGGPAAAAELSNPGFITFDARGNLYVDGDCGIVKVNSTGRASVYLTPPQA